MASLIRVRRKGKVYRPLHSVAGPSWDAEWLAKRKAANAAWEREKAKRQKSIIAAYYAKKKAENRALWPWGGLAGHVEERQDAPR
jgi:hypothetical protein